MTTSYELSLRLKELGVEQTGGEYYWVLTDEGETYCYHHSDSMCNTSNGYTILCAALTLGELVRMLGKHIEFEILFLNHKHGKEVFARRKNYFTGRCSRTEKEHSPEEAAAELVIELVKSGVIKFEPPVAPNEKDFAQWITEDALPTTKDILAELREINRKRDEAKSWLTENNIDITEQK